MDSASPFAFWSWFRAHQERFRDLDVPEREERLDELLRHLHAYCDQLFFEIGGHPDGPCELVLSAEGDPEHFPEVRRLAAAAPDIPGWKIIAFKPPQGFDFVTNWEGLTIAPSATWFLPLEAPSDPDLFGVRVGFAHFDPRRERDFLAATFIMLEAGLGELALAERIHHVEVGLLPDSPESAGYIDLLALPAYLASNSQED